MAKARILIAGSKLITNAETGKSVIKVTGYEPHNDTTPLIVHCSPMYKDDVAVGNCAIVDYEFRKAGTKYSWVDKKGVKGNGEATVDGNWGENVELYPLFLWERDSNRTFLESVADTADKQAVALSVQRR